MMTVFKTRLMLPLLAAVPMAGIGCGGSSEYMDMPVPEVWTQMEADSDDTTFWSEFFKQDDGSDSVVSRMMANDNQKREELQAQADKDMASPRAVIELNEMVDEAAQLFANELSQDEEIKASPYQLVLVVDEVSNETGVENPGLDQALKSVMSRLQRNKSLRESFVFLTSNDDAAKRILTNTSGDWSGFDPFGETGGTDIVKYHPDYVYVLKGSMSRLADPSRYLMQLTLNIDTFHPRTKQLKVPFERQRRYYYHPKRKWISEDLNERLRSEWRAAEAEG